MISDQTNRDRYTLDRSDVSVEHQSGTSHEGTVFKLDCRGESTTRIAGFGDFSRSGDETSAESR